MDLSDVAQPCSLSKVWHGKVRVNLAVEAFPIASAQEPAGALTCWRAALCLWGWEPALLPLGLLEHIPASVCSISSHSVVHLPSPRAKTGSQELIVVCRFPPVLCCGLISIWAHWALEEFASPSVETAAGELSSSHSALDPRC